jgi:ketopantoate reductase
VSRTEGWEALERPQGDPVLVLVRNADIDDVLARVPLHRRDDLVFVQNGALRSFFAERGLAGNTRGLLYFAVAKKGQDVVPGLPSPMCGPHGLAVARWMTELGIEAVEMPWARFGYYELEKLLWLVCHGILCEAHGGITVGELVQSHRDELHALVAELLPVGRATFHVEAPADYVTERLVAYSLTIPSWGSSVKEWPYRNGWFAAQARSHGIDTPIHDGLIEQLGLPR